MSRVVLSSLVVLLLPTFVFTARECKTRLENEGMSNLYANTFKWSPPKFTPDVKRNVVAPGQNVLAECQNGFVRNDLPGKSFNLKCTNRKFNDTFYYEDLFCRSDYHKNSLAVRISPTQLYSRVFKCDNRDWEAYQMRTVQADGTSTVLYSVCLDAKIMRTKFVYQPPRSERPPVGHAWEERSDVWGFDGYGRTVHEMQVLSKGYSKKSQRPRITKMFPNKYSANRQFPYYFNRGHLAPYADYAKDTEKRATCQYLNAAPQWETLNKQQWSLVEREVRAMRQANPSEWEVYTGTYGTIPTERGPMYVAPLFENNRFKKALLPVPMLFWKLVYNVNDKRKSKAFVGVNNPDIKSPEGIINQYRLCTPINTGNGASTVEGSEFLGFVYQCNVDDLLRALNAEKIVK